MLRKRAGWQRPSDDPLRGLGAGSADWVQERGGDAVSEPVVQAVRHLWHGGGAAATCCALRPRGRHVHAALCRALPVPQRQGAAGGHAESHVYKRRIARNLDDVQFLQSRQHSNNLFDMQAVILSRLNALITRSRAAAYCVHELAG